MARFAKAQRKKARARVALIGPSGSGKSMSALLLAKGLGGKVAAIDTENGSLSLYSHLHDFDVCELVAPYTPERYIELIHDAEAAGYDAIVIDSLTHEWGGVGGLLEIHDKMPGNSWANWASVTPRHQKLIDAMLQSPCHIIATMRSKTEYAQTERNGKTEIKKMGTAPQQRDGMDYEFTVVFDISAEHVASAGKDRTGLFDSKYDKITEQHGVTLRDWLDGGAEPTPAAPTAEAHALTSQSRMEIEKAAKNAGLSRDGYANWLKEKGYTSTTEIPQGHAQECIDELSAMIPDQAATYNGVTA